MKRIISLILTVAMVLSCVFALASCGGKQSDLQAVKDAGKIVVGITNYEPMDYPDANGKWIGFDAELAEQFAESLGVECVFFEIADWNNKVADINAKEIDLIWNGMTASDELGEKIDFSVSYAKNAQVVVVKKGSGITKDNLAGKSIAVENGSAGAKVAEDTIKPTTLYKLKKQLDALNEVDAGTSDAAVIDLTMAQSKLGKGAYDDLEVLEGAQYGDEIFAVGLRKGSDLKAELDKFLKAKYADGTMKALSDKYDSAIVINEEALK